jgi:hypothetical protein
MVMARSFPSIHFFGFGHPMRTSVARRRDAVNGPASGRRYRSVALATGLR